ncbi:MAG: hypothetical protein OEL20_04615 [Sulfuritalea sp.]|nr:hypothetical protein [Sulfuritalea sp.]
MAPILVPSKTRRYLAEGLDRRRYLSTAKAAVKAQREGFSLWVPLRTGWTCDPDKVAEQIRKDLQQARSRRFAPVQIVRGTEQQFPRHEHA